MNLSFNLYDSPPEWWDKEVEKHEGMFAASSAWANFHEELGIAKGKYLEISEQGHRVMLILFCDLLVGGQFLLFLPKFILRLLHLIPFLKTYYFYLQPVIIERRIVNESGVNKEITSAVIKYLLDLAQKNNRSISPSIYLGFTNSKIPNDFVKKYKPSLKVAGTTRLLLTSEEEIFSQLPSDVRYKISKAAKSDIEVKLLNPGEASLYVKGLEESYHSYRFAKYSSVYDYVLKSLYPENIKHLVALQDGKVLAGSVLMLFGQTMMEGAYVTPVGRSSKISAGDLLKWEAIKYGLNHGYKLMEFNMIDVSSDNDDEKTKKISYFKLKWGGNIIYGLEFNYLNWLLKIVRRVKKLFRE